MKTLFPWPERRVYSVEHEQYAERVSLRKNRPVLQKWDIALLVCDAIEDLEFSLQCGFAKAFGQRGLDIDELSRQVMEQTKGLNLSKTKPKPAQKIAQRIFLQTNDLEFACKYSLSKSIKLLRIAQGAVSKENYGRAFSFLLKASIEHGVYMSLQRYRLTRSIQTTKGARAKLANDPKQIEKAFVRECWNQWQLSHNPKQVYGGKASFARDMIEKCEHLTSQKKIEDWCRDWEKESITQLAE